MAVVNRCAVVIYPSKKLLDWARGPDLDVDAAEAREPCFYLIPDYDTQKEAEEILEEVYEAIFEAEHDYWHRDTGTWPAERTYPVFRSTRSGGGMKLRSIALSWICPSDCRLKRSQDQRRSSNGPHLRPGNQPQAIRVASRRAVHAISIPLNVYDKEKNSL